MEEPTAAELGDKVVQLRLAVEHRTVIGMSLGILMERLNVGQRPGLRIPQTRVPGQQHQGVRPRQSIVSTRQLPRENKAS